jgi:hypothetical protein
MKSRDVTKEHDAAINVSYQLAAGDSRPTKG